MRKRSELQLGRRLKKARRANKQRSFGARALSALAVSFCCRCLRLPVFVARFFVFGRLFVANCKARRKQNKHKPSSKWKKITFEAEAQTVSARQSREVRKSQFSRALRRVVRLARASKTKQLEMRFRFDKDANNFQLSTLHSTLSKQSSKTRYLRAANCELQLISRRQTAITKQQTLKRKPFSCELASGSFFTFSSSLFILMLVCLLQVGLFAGQTATHINKNCAPNKIQSRALFNFSYLGALRVARGFYLVELRNKQANKAAPNCARREARKVKVVQICCRFSCLARTCGASSREL